MVSAVSEGQSDCDNISILTRVRYKRHPVTATLGGLKNITRYTKDFIKKELVISEFYWPAACVVTFFFALGQNERPIAGYKCC